MEKVLIYGFLFIFLVLAVLLYTGLLVIQRFNIRLNIDAKRHAALEHVILLSALTFGWYSVSLSFTLYNKWLLQEWEGGFNYPILITSVHMVVKLLFTRVWQCTPCCEVVQKLPWRTVLLIVFPIGAFTAMDIVFSNFAVYYLPLSMYTTIKGSTLVFTFVWGVIFGVQDFSWSLCGAVSLLSLGLALAVGTVEMKLSVVGIIFAMGSATAGALRWVLMQLLAVRDPQSKSVMVTLYRFSPFGALAVLPFGIGIDGTNVQNSKFSIGEEPYLVNYAIMYAAIGGFFSIALILVEVKLLRETSSLTMSVIGQVKEIVQILAAMLLFAENLGVKSTVGIGLSIVAAYLYRRILMRDGESSVKSTAGAREVNDSDDDDDNGADEGFIPREIGLQMMSFTAQNRSNNGGGYSSLRRESDNGDCVYDSDFVLPTAGSRKAEAQAVDDDRGDQQRVDSMEKAVELENLNMKIIRAVFSGKMVNGGSFTSVKEGEEGECDELEQGEPLLVGNEGVVHDATKQPMNRNVTKAKSPSGHIQSNNPNGNQIHGQASHNSNGDLAIKGSTSLKTYPIGSTIHL